jgi:CheY-like chemotaxis protein
LEDLLQPLIMSSPKILVTEDMVINQVLAKVLFRNLGLKVIFASSGKESWELLMEEAVDIWFVDYYLPDMNGIQAVQGIEINPMPYLIMMSGKPFSSSELKEIDKVFPSRIEKPLTKDHILYGLHQAGWTGN